MKSFVLKQDEEIELGSIGVWTTATKSIWHWGSISWCRWRASKVSLCP